MARKTIVVLLIGLAFALVHPVEAQQPKKIPRIGFLGGSSASAYSSFIEAFRQGLRDLGYEEGQNIAIDYRYGEGKRERLPDLSGDLGRLKVDVIVVSGALAISAQHQAPLSPSKRLRLWPRHWVFSFNPWMCGAPTISRVHSGQQPLNELAL